MKISNLTSFDKMNKPKDNFLSEDSAEKISTKILSEYKELLGEEIYEKWFDKLKIECASANELIFLAPSKFVRDWLNREFFHKKEFLSKIRSKNPQLIKISAVYIESKSVKISSTSSENIEKSTFNSRNHEEIFAKNLPLNLSKFDNVFAYGTELNPRFTFENFIPAKFNKISLSMAKIVANCIEAPRLFEDKIPLFIHGGVGMGKTHLAQAIAWQIRKENKNTKTVYLSAEKFMFHFVRSLRGNQIMDFKERMRSIDVLIVDDVQFIAGKESTQQEFMNCFNSLVEDNKQVVLVCDRCPNELENIDEKLKSRIAGGMIANFKSPDFADRLAILKNKALAMNLELSSEIFQLLAKNILGSVRDLEGSLKKLYAEKTIGGEEISLENVKLSIASYLKKNLIAKCEVEKIQKVVAKYFGIKVDDLCSSSRVRSNVRARQIAIYLSKAKTDESLHILGQKYGGKNHATVIHSIKIVSNLLNSCQKTIADIEKLESELER